MLFLECIPTKKMYTIHSLDLVNFIFCVSIKKGQKKKLNILGLFFVKTL